MLELLSIPLALAAGTLVLTLARARELTRALPPTVDPTRPLAPGELLRLHRWERRLRRVAVLIALAYLLLLGAWSVRDRMTTADPRWALALLALATLAGAAAQFSERCPRCGYNLGYQSRLTLPAACERCGGENR